MRGRTYDWPDTRLKWFPNPLKDDLPLWHFPAVRVCRADGLVALRQLLAAAEAATVDPAAREARHAWAREQHQAMRAEWQAARTPPADGTITADWLDSWERFAALNATHVIPGHGGPTSMAEVTKYTRDYLVYLRGKVRELLDAGGSLKDSYDVDQSPYAKLHTFNELAKRNAERVYREMEFE